MTDFGALSAAFRRFREVEVPSGDSPLYETLALAVAGDRDLLEIASHRQAGQPVANMLFGAVHGPTETTNAGHRALIDRVRDDMVSKGIAVFPSVERAAWAMGKLAGV